MGIGANRSVPFKILKQKNQGFTLAIDVPGYFVYTLVRVIKNIAYRYQSSYQ